jgi:hypothetical protein
LLLDGDVFDFGRGVDCPIRFAYAPIQDDAVPRLAGQLVVANQRVFVEGVDAPGRPAIEIAVPGSPAVPVALGEAHSPRAPRFAVHVRGTNQIWKLVVTVRADGAALRREPVGPPRGPTCSSDADAAQGGRGLPGPRTRPARAGDPQGPPA